MRVFVGVLLVIGFGAKLGLLPFYEWFPGGLWRPAAVPPARLLSGVVLNAAFFGLSRGLLEWLPGVQAVGATGLGEFVVAAAVLSAILSALYAFQQEDWRALLSLSSAENAAIAVAALGAALMFRGDRLPALASLAWTVALLHLAGHALAKGGLFLAADGVFRATGTYAILHTDLLRRAPLAVRRRRGVCRDELGGDAAASRLCQRMVHLSDCVPGLSSVEFGQPADPGIGRRRPRPDRGRRLRRVCQIDRRRSFGTCRRAERPVADGHRDRGRPPRARGAGACRRHALLAVGARSRGLARIRDIDRRTNERWPDPRARYRIADPVDRHLRLHFAEPLDHRHAAVGAVAADDAAGEPALPGAPGAGVVWRARSRPDARLDDGVELCQRVAHFLQLCLPAARGDRARDQRARAIL